MSEPAAPRLPLWLFAGAAVLQLLVFFPGYVSFDVLSQLEQARRGVIDDVSPPAAALLFRAGEQLIAGTGSVFVLNTLLFWGGCALIWRGARLGAFAAGCAALFALPLCLLLPQVWTDLHLLSVLTLATGVALALRRARAGAGNVLLWLLLLGLLGWATWVRHNAILAVVPLAWLLLPAAPSLARRADARRGPRVALWLALVLLLIGVRSAGTLVVDNRVSVWAVTTMWDLQALSIATGELRFPVGFVGPQMQLDSMRATYSENTAVPLFETPGGVRNPTLERLPPEAAAALGRAWLSALSDAPLAWVQHRLRVFLRLFGPHHEGNLTYMVDSPQFAPDAQRAAWQETLHTPLRAGLDRYKAWGGASAGVFLLLALFAYAAGRSRQREHDVLPVCLLLSALLYTAALLPLTPSAELRYLAWPLWACALAAVLVFAPAVRR